MDYEALMCPVCGAPYRKVVPAGVVHVKCSYCGGMIVIPSSAPRCPNHPDVLALSLCNDCGKSYCSGCLSRYVLEGGQESGVIRICPNCLKWRYVERAERFIIFGVLSLAFGLLVLFVEPILGVVWIAFLAVPVIVYGFYKVRLLHREGVVIYEGAREGPRRTPHEIYQDMLNEYVRAFGVAQGSIMLENRLESYIRDGVSREEAVRKLAKDEGYA